MASTIGSKLLICNIYKYVCRPPMRELMLFFIYYYIIYFFPLTTPGFRLMGAARLDVGGQSKLRLAEEDTGRGGLEEFGAEKRKRKGKRSKSWGGGLSSRRYSLSFFSFSRSFHFVFPLLSTAWRWRRDTGGVGDAS